MKKIILIIFAALSIFQLPAQNLVINPDAESLPRGTGWTVISSGALTCLLIPTNNVLNWTMKPDGTPNYPFDHTTGASGGTVFFSGCDTYFQGPFELQQTIDVTTDAATIDMGNQLYDFSGYMQTPVSNQTDQGRFIVECLNASNTVLGSSYSSNWQSNFGGSGTSWIQYTNTRTAPAGTRKIRIRMQTQLAINQPAINVYFDDISLNKPTVVPLGLLSFTGVEAGGNIFLNWKISDELNCKKIELERSTTADHFSKIATLVATGNSTYEFVDDNYSRYTGNYFYRLKMTAIDGSIAYSNIIMIRIAGNPSITVSPNPANDIITITGLSQPGIVSVIHYSGSTVLTTNTNASSLKLNVSNIPAGLYMVRFGYQKNSIHKKLVIRH
ncbi:MAG: T9SS type A sorting domain-containing protein [Chitinophagaceae bacterium]|nr:T9SS type A sorting domain-containing protein [Chitinophagaceae bacterium]